MIHYWAVHPLSCTLPQPEGNSDVGKGHMWGISLAQGILPQGTEGAGMADTLPLASGI